MHYHACSIFYKELLILVQYYIVNYMIIPGLLYTAPEHLRNTDVNHEGSQKGDVYSYGIIIQELLTRTPPFGSYSQNPEGLV